MSTTLFRAFHVTDLHLSPLDRSPQSRSETYHNDTRFEWDAFCQIVAADRPDCVLVSGDYFHNKNQKLYSPPDIEYYRQFFAQLGCVLYGIPGNHDLPKSSYALVEGTAYDNLLHASEGRIVDVHLQPAAVTRNGLTTGIWGLPYFPLDTFLQKLPELDAQIAAGGHKINIVLLHPDALPKADDSMPFDVCSWQDILNLLPSATVCCLGHIHQSFPVLQQAGPKGPQFVSKPWSFARIVKDYFQSTATLEHTHKPMFADIHLLIPDPVDGKALPPQLTVTYREIPYIPFERAFNPESLRRDIERSGKISSFITTLRQNYGTVENAFQIEDPEAFLARQQITPVVREMIQRYLQDD